MVESEQHASDSLNVVCEGRRVVMPSAPNRSTSRILTSSTLKLLRNVRPSIGSVVLCGLSGLEHKRFIV
ncbi:hypothetical protein CCR75_001668 [Bremia lactucae]|uniref:Uncharacterized protein n=1 Tax=Bremia lactucae TaxID=4779 RepID=A0A976IFV4_BRELC|nr:hypothetical protein CCR75_001668 [Bremia lactucae]